MDKAGGQRPDIVGVDRYPFAVKTAQQNLLHNVDVRRDVHKSAFSHVDFHWDDIFNPRLPPLNPDDTVQDPKKTSYLSSWLYMPPSNASTSIDELGYQSYDILVANPPQKHKSKPRDFVFSPARHEERQAALVPPIAEQLLSPSAPPGHLELSFDDEQDGRGDKIVRNDTSKNQSYFYPRLVEIAQQVKAKVVLFEAKDQKQAERVIRILKTATKRQLEVASPDGQLEGSRDVWAGYRIWHNLYPQGSSAAVGDVTKHERSQARAVLAWTEKGRRLLRLDGELEGSTETGPLVRREAQSEDSPFRFVTVSLGGLRKPADPRPTGASRHGFKEDSK